MKQPVFLLMQELVRICIYCDDVVSVGCLRNKLNMLLMSLLVMYLLRKLQFCTEWKMQFCLRLVSKVVVEKPVKQVSG